MSSTSLAGMAAMGGSIIFSEHGVLMDAVLVVVTGRVTQLGEKSRETASVLHARHQSAAGPEARQFSTSRSTDTHR